MAEEIIAPDKISALSRRSPRRSPEEYEEIAPPDSEETVALESEEITAHRSSRRTPRAAPWIPRSRIPRTTSGTSRRRSRAADSVDLLLSVEGLDSVDPLQSIEALDSVIVQDSFEMEMEMEMVSDSMESPTLSSEMELVDSIAADSEIVAPDSLPPRAFICGRCQVVHLNREAWDRMHPRKYPCSRCGLEHDDYLIRASRCGLEHDGYLIRATHYFCTRGNRNAI